ncbi:MAG: hypothetical protein ACW97O_11860 [Candidatus Thorarchaeota archaeon]|jgi:hypothetical protein
MGDSWTRSSSSEYIDIHDKLFPYQRVLEFFEEVESEYEVLKYCSGVNERGRWIFQIYSTEFIEEVADLLKGFQMTENPHGTILEVMSGDGKLTEFLKPLVSTKMIATDARIGNYGIAYPKWVENLDAIEALSTYRPDVVVIAWEPFYSSIGLEVVETGTPMMWIGDRRHSAVHSGLFDKDFTRVNSRYALGRRDSFVARQFETDIYLFNWLDR